MVILAHLSLKLGGTNLLSEETIPNIIIAKRHLNISSTKWVKFLFNDHGNRGNHSNHHHHQYLIKLVKYIIYGSLKPDGLPQHIHKHRCTQ